MDTRNTSSSGKKRRKKTSHGNSSQPAGNIVASKQIELFICPLTTEILFEPVMIAGCKHLIEGRRAPGLVKSSDASCPLCRFHELTNDGKKAISLLSAPPVLTSILESTLKADPSLWQQVYLDHDYLNEVLRNEELNTPTGERFIKLLENNSADNLNEQPLIQRNGKVEKGKSAIEILASHYAGRELLRSNAKIQSLISEKTKELEADGKAIAEWLAMEKEEKPVAKEKKKKKRKHKDQPSANGMFANNARPAHQVEDNVWQKTIDGKENAAKALLEANPEDIFTKRNITEHTLREVNNASPFQIALRCGDVEMAEIIKRIALDNFADGQARLDAEYQEVFPNGYEAHVTEQSNNTFNFNNIVNAISDARPEDLTAALAKRNNRSALCQALDQFRDDFDEKSLGEEVFNPNHLLKAMEIYNAKFSSWNWNQRDLFWRQVIGYTQRYLPSCYKQAFCQGLYNLTEKNPKDPLTRQETLENWLTNRTIRFDELDADRNSRLGFDFGVYSYEGAGLPARMRVPRVCRWRGSFQKLMSDKNSQLGRIMQRESNRHSPGCLIM